MLTREQKTEAVSELTEKFSRATSVFVADYRGLSVEDVRELRGKIRDESAEDFEYRVAKNSLLSLAAEGQDAEVLRPHFNGPTAVAV